MRDVISTLDLPELNHHQAQLFKDVLRLASKDRYLSPDEKNTVPKKARCVVILFNGDPVGFYCPKSQLWNGRRYYRAGTCFIAPKYQGRGIMGEVLKRYFDRYSHALSWIENGNTKSIALFTSLGFVKDKAKDYDGYHGHWYVKRSTALSAEHYTPASTRW